MKCDANVVGCQWAGIRKDIEQHHQSCDVYKMRDVLGKWQNHLQTLQEKIVTQQEQLQQSDKQSQMLREKIQEQQEQLQLSEKQSQMLRDKMQDQLQQSEKQSQMLRDKTQEQLQQSEQQSQMFKDKIQEQQEQLQQFGKQSQILKDKMQEQQEQHQKELAQSKRNVIIDIYPGPVANPQSDVQTAKIAITEGKWLVEMSFQVTFANWGNGSGGISYLLKANGTTINGGGHNVADGQPSGANYRPNYPVPIVERYVVDGPKSLVLEFTQSPT